jgi:hypothetical protein
MPAPLLPQFVAARNLLFGILAFQKNLIDRDASSGP